MNKEIKLSEYDIKKLEEINNKYFCKKIDSFNLGELNKDITLLCEDNKFLEGNVINKFECVKSNIYEMLEIPCEINE